jgi:hypothetical protein
MTQRGLTFSALYYSHHRASFASRAQPNDEEGGLAPSQNFATVGSRPRRIGLTKGIEKGSAMKRVVLIASLMIGLAAYAADSKDEVTAAAKKLAEAPNYSWKSTVKVPEDSQFKPGPTDGKADKDGTILLTIMRGDNLTEAVKKGEKGAMTNRDGDWQSLAEIEAETEGFARFRAMMLRDFKSPSEQAIELANATKELKSEDGAISGDLTPEGAKQFLRFGRGGNGPAVNNAKGSVKFWIKDGMLTKYEYHVKGSINFNGEDRDIDRTTTTEISKVGETKLVVPEAAKKKLS